MAEFLDFFVVKMAWSGLMESFINRSLLDTSYSSILKNLIYGITEIYLREYRSFRK